MGYVRHGNAVVMVGLVADAAALLLHRAADLGSARLGSLTRSLAYSLVRLFVRSVCRAWRSNSPG